MKLHSVENEVLFSFCRAKNNIFKTVFYPRGLEMYFDPAESTHYFFVLSFRSPIIAGKGTFRVSEIMSAMEELGRLARQKRENKQE